MKHTAVYIRVSTLKQETGLDSQQSALEEYCKNHGISNYKVYKDRLTGGNLDRPALQRLQDDIFRGRVDTVVVWKLDRLSRSLKDGINLLCSWLEKDIRIIAISQNFDLSGAVGKMIMSLLLGIAEMERANIRENIVRGLHRAKQKGIQLGGSDPQYNYSEITALKNQGMSVSQISRHLGCTRQTVYTALKQGQQLSA
jgi:DNA invertase Pin-like site-specific DNA recombinase